MTLLQETDFLLGPPKLPEIPLPKGWSQYTLLAVLHVIALARIIVLNVVNWPSDSECDGLKLRCENDRLRGEIDLLQREIDIKDARFARIETKSDRPTMRSNDSRYLRSKLFVVGATKRLPSGFKSANAAFAVGFVELKHKTASHKCRRLCLAIPIMYGMSCDI